MKKLNSRQPFCKSTTIAAALCVACLTPGTLWAGSMSTGWQSVGTPGFSAVSPWAFGLAVSEGVPYVAIGDDDNGQKATVMRYTSGSWQTVGSAGFSTATVYDVELGFNQGEVYMLYRGSTADGLKRYRSNSWEAVGGDFAAGGAFHPSLAFDDQDQPHVAFMDNTNSDKATVVRYTGSAWETVGTAFSAGTATHLSLAFYNDEPYVAFADGANSSKATVMHYTGGSWQLVGTGAFSAGAGTHCSLAFDESGTPYVAYTDGALADKATVMRYTEGAWETVGTAGFSTSSTSNLSLIIHGGELYVGFSDGGNSHKATVMHYTNGSWQTLGTAGFSDGWVGSPVLVADNGRLYMGYIDNGHSKKASVYEFFGPPTVTTNAVSSITETAADVSGVVTSDHGVTVTQRGVCWSTTSPPTTADNTATNGTGMGSFTASLTGLAPGTTYYVRAYATNKLGTSYGAEESFTTAAAAAALATVSTTAASNITATSAESGGNVTADGGATVTKRGVCWSTNSLPTTADNTAQSGTGTGSYAASLTELTPETTYYVRAYVTNSAGTAYGDTLSFTTQAAPVSEPDTTGDPNSVDEPDTSGAPQLAVSIRMSADSRDDDGSSEPSGNTANVAVGDDLSVVVTIQNTGTAVATRVTTTIPIPDGLEFIAAYRMSGDPSAQDAPLNATVVDDTVILELDQVGVDESVDVDVQFQAMAAGAVMFEASVNSEEISTPITAQADTEVDVDDTYWEVRTTGLVPVLPCSLVGFGSLLGLIGAIRMTRRSKV